MDTQQEFVAFKRANITKWGSIQQVINQLERFIGQFNVTFAHIDCLRVLYYSDQEFEQLTNQDLFSCIINKQQCWDNMFNPKFKFKGPQGPVLAAVHIQKHYRRFKAFSAYAQLRYLMEKATIIQRRYRLYQLKKSTKMRVKELQKESL